MKLAAIYNVWDGVELLNKSMQSVADGVDCFIIVYQTVSNFGEQYDPLPEINDSILNLQLNPGTEIIISKFDPSQNTTHGAGIYERKKRNIGLDIAKQNNCTHFLHMDCDEFYLNFLEMKKYFTQSGADASVCKIFTYFKEPTLRLMYHDNYFVPFIHELKHETCAGKLNQKQYGSYVDPTRTITPIKNAPIIIGDMHHFSWIRKNIYRKINNSTARGNIERSNLLADYLNPETSVGTTLKDYQNQKLIRVHDYFKIGNFKN